MAGIHERYERLLEAGLALAAELSLPAALQRIVELAAELTDARYGALGVAGPGRPHHRVHHHRGQRRRAGGDRPHPGRPGHPRRADRRRPAAAAPRHRRGSPIGRLPGQPPADAVVPRGSGHRPWPGVRQPVHDREARRRGLRRRRRAGPGPAGHPGRGGHRERLPVRGGPGPRPAAGGGPGHHHGDPGRHRQRRDPRPGRAATPGSWSAPTWPPSPCRRGPTGW